MVVNPICPSNSGAKSRCLRKDHTTGLMSAHKSATMRHLARHEALCIGIAGHAGNGRHRRPAALCPAFK